MVAKMLADGVPHDAIVLAIQTAEAIAVYARPPDNPPDKMAEKRRAWDREYRRERRKSTRNPPDPPDCPLSASTKKEEVKKSRGARLDVGWTPSDSDTAFAKARGWSSSLIETEAIKFRNHWTSKTGKDATKLDWSRTWQNWVLNARLPNGHANPDSGYKPSVLNFDGPQSSFYPKGYVPP